MYMYTLILYMYTFQYTCILYTLSVVYDNYAVYDCILLFRLPNNVHKI